jgi:hypothetical protein
MAEKITMVDRVLKYMQDFGSITTFEAFTELGCTRLSEYIRQIRLIMNVDDEWIQKVNRYGDKVQFKKYWIAERQ